MFDEKPKENILESEAEQMIQQENEQETAGNLPNKGNPTDGGNKKLEITASSIEGEDLGQGDPLPPIDPTDSESPVNKYDEETIVVRRPHSTVEVTAAAAEAPASVPTLWRSGRTYPTRQMFRLGASPAYLAVLEEPLTLGQALDGENAADWKKAWESELNSLLMNGTWRIEKIPEGRKIVGSRWLFQRKQDGRFKVRLVAKGFSQQPGVDLHETFAPVAKFTTLRVLLALVAENDWELHSMDVKTAFLNGKLEEEVFMECPEGLDEVPGPGYACRLIKAIYGLRQPPIVWYHKIHASFAQHDFNRSTQDYSLYINYDRMILALVYVDDLVLAAANSKEIGWIKGELAEEFEMTDLGELTAFLGLEIGRVRSQRLIALSQREYIERILLQYGMQDSRPCLTPLDSNTRLQPCSAEAKDGGQSEGVDLELYQSAVGSLMYAMLGTRPDLAYAVGTVSQFNHAPGLQHWTAVKRIFRYLVGTKHMSLQYGTRTCHGSGGYSDADWGAGHDRKSIGGFVFVLNGGAISWASKKQTSIALSTTEAEYMGMTQAAKEILWLRVLRDEIGAFRLVASMSTLNADNQGAIALARNPAYHASTKHIDIQYHFIQNLVTTDQIYLQFCPSTHMIADIMTKALLPVSNVKHLEAMGVTTGYGPLR